MKLGGKESRKIILEGFACLNELFKWVMKGLLFNELGEEDDLV